MVQVRPDLHGCCGLAGLASRDREDAGLIGTARASGGLRDVQTRALGSAKRLIPQAHICDFRFSHDRQQLGRDFVRNETVMGKADCPRHVKSRGKP